jgi:hypothetical protein
MKSIAVSALALTLALPVLAEDAALTPLFDGKTLDGWVQRGGKAAYSVEGGCVVGRTVKGEPNSFLTTAKDYSDFVLEYDFKVDPKLNSGVQFRSECFAEAKKIEHEGKQIEIPAGRVHGYQCEIDNDPKRDRWWSAGVYEEGCRGWLFPGIDGGDGKAFTEQGRKVSKQDDWNHVRIEAKGSSIKTFLNGEPRADLKDARTASGFIALQVHGHPEAGLEVRWRNIRIQAIVPPTDTAAK